MEEVSTGSAAIAGTPSVATTPDISSAAATTSTVDVSSQVPQTTQQTTNEAWYKSLGNDELKGYAELRNWKDVDSVVESYKNLETLLGADKAGRGLIMPTEDADQSAWDELYTKLGRPESPADYKLSGGDNGLVEKASEWMHKAGLNAKQAQAIAEQWNAHVTELQAGQAKEYEQRTANELEAIKKEWGINYDKNVEYSRRGMKAAGLEESDLNAIERSLGTSKMLEMLRRIGASYSEDTFRSSNGTIHPFGMSPEAARVKINELKKDKTWGAKYLAGDIDARNEMNQLHQVAYGA